MVVPEITEALAARLIADQFPQWAHLPVAVPKPLDVGRPALGYPFAWSVNEWRDGQVLSRAGRLDPAALAEALACFLVALRAARFRPRA